METRQIESEAPFEIESPFPAECWVWRFENGNIWLNRKDGVWRRMMSVSAKGIYSAAKARFGSKTNSGKFPMESGFPDKATARDFTGFSVGSGIALLNDDGVEIAYRSFK